MRDMTEKMAEGLPLGEFSVDEFVANLEKQARAICEEQGDDWKETAFLSVDLCDKEIVMAIVGGKPLVSMGVDDVVDVVGRLLSLVSGIMKEEKRARDEFLKKQNEFLKAITANFPPETDPLSSLFGTPINGPAAGEK